MCASISASAAAWSMNEDTRSRCLLARSAAAPRASRRAGVSTPRNVTERCVDRFRGALLGLAVGDAVGTTVEFMAPGTFEPVRDMVGGGPFSLPPGAWTDDTSMALCLAESLVERRRLRSRRPARALRPLVPRGALVEHRQLLRHRQRHPRGAGALRAHGRAVSGRRRSGRRRQRAADEARAGRPRLRRRDREDAVRFAAESARTTHGAPEAADACALVRAAAAEPRWRATIRWRSPVDESLHPKVVAAARSTREPPAVRGGGYVVDALEAALWALRSTSTFEAGVLAAVNLGDDADTTAAIYGQLAGAVYGLDGHPAAVARAGPDARRDPRLRRRAVLTSNHERLRPFHDRRDPRHAARADPRGGAREGRVAAADRRRRRAGVPHAQPPAEARRAVRRA